VDLMKDERYGDMGAGGIDINAETIRESLIGDRFELQGEINRGSMGIVYRALDRTLDEVVAIKVLNDFLTSDPKAVARFKQECRSARRLSHPNIVRIHDFLDLDDRKLISMEYIEGEDLKNMLSRHVTLTEDMIYNYLRQICDAMAYAHNLGIIHRDLKPANIMIDERNQVKVTDFGIAKVIDASSTNNGTMIMGTPLYMSPEQIQGGKIDRRVDIYALGVMLYELVTGAPPFYEGNIEYQHIHNPVPEMKISLSEALKTIILKCVEKRVEDRFGSFEEIQAALPE
jgi:serine/threonine-protein kinase